MNIQAQLQPKNYAVEYLAIESNPSFRPTGKKEKLELNFGIAPKLKQKKDTNEYLLQIEIRINESAKAFKKAPYRITLRQATWFEVEPEVSEEKRNELLTLNTLAIAYGIARGVVGQATAQGLHGKFVLPAVNFVEMVKGMKKKRI